MEVSCTSFKEEDFLKSIVNNTDSINTIDVVILINELHKSLSDEYEAGLQINRTGKNVLLYIDHIAHKNNSMIYFKGQTKGGKQMHIVKHLSDLDVELVPLDRRLKKEQKTPLGFANWEEYENEKLKNKKRLLKYLFELSN